MGFFDKLFGNKAEEEETAKFFGQSKTVLAPIRGKVLAQADITGVAFTQRSCWNKCDFFIFNFFLYQTSYT